jgi:hypothetical protein
MADVRELLSIAGRQLAVGLGRIGARATAQAARSVTRDIDSIVGEAKKRTEAARKKFEDFLGVDQDQDRP